MTAIAEPLAPARHRPRARLLRELVRRPSVALAAAAVILIVIGVVFAPLIAPYSPDAFSFGHLFAPPSWAHPFGTDELGRDLLTRVMYGGRASLSIAALAVVFAMTGGATWGFVAAYVRGWVDEVLMRVADLTLGMPVILVGLVLVAAFGSSTLSLVLILGILFMPATARLARATLLSELEADYCLAAISVGTPPWQIMVRELLPNTAPVLIARASVIAAEAIFVEASLSFVGLGVQPPGTSWGTLLQKGYSNLYKSYWYPFFPGLVLLIAVLSLNTLGDHLQRILDPAKR